VNVQGDEPFIAASQLESIIRCFDDERTQIATLVQPFKATDNVEALVNPNSPKVVVGTDDRALYFSRSVIPFLRGVPQEEWLKRHTFFKHIGLYAYRAETLAHITSLPAGRLEQAESLEQLRWLEAGLHIRVGYTDVSTIGIDTPQDLAAAEAYLAAQK
jgi:3-deoxy-manno-octulosonate cytidylyltransferase (CMP-KDO synthetase)